METDVRPTKRTSTQQCGTAEFSSINGIQARRVAAEISATLLRTSGRVRSTKDELQRLGIALDQLIAEGRKVQELAAAVGWPA